MPTIRTLHVAPDLERQSGRLYEHSTESGAAVGAQLSGRTIEIGDRRLLHVRFADHSKPDGAIWSQCAFDLHDNALVAFVSATSEKRAYEKLAAELRLKSVDLSD